jgi:hypothetical protein
MESIGWVQHYDHTATLLPNGKVLVAGGGDFQSHSQRDVELYNPDTGAPTTINSMIGPRMDHTAALLPNGQVLVAGGAGSTRVIELYDPNTGTWKTTGLMNVARGDGHTATL